MKTNKYVEELKAKTAAELNEELVAAKKELFNLRFQNATNQLDNILKRSISIRACRPISRRTFSFSIR